VVDALQLRVQTGRFGAPAGETAAQGRRQSAVAEKRRPRVAGGRKVSVGLHEPSAASEMGRFVAENGLLVTLHLVLSKGCFENSASQFKGCLLCPLLWRQRLFHLVLVDAVVLQGNFSRFQGVLIFCLSFRI